MVPLDTDLYPTILSFLDPAPPTIASLRLVDKTWYYAADQLFFNTLNLTGVADAQNRFCREFILTNRRLQFVRHLVVRSTFRTQENVLTRHTFDKLRDHKKITHMILLMKDDEGSDLEAPALSEFLTLCTSVIRFSVHGCKAGLPFRVLERLSPVVVHVDFYEINIQVLLPPKLLHNIRPKLLVLDYRFSSRTQGIFDWFNCSELSAIVLKVERWGWDHRILEGILRYAPLLTGLVLDISGA